MKGSGEYSAKQHCNLNGVSTVKFIHRQHQNVPSAFITKVETMMWVNLTTVPMLSVKELCNDSARQC